MQESNYLKKVKLRYMVLLMIILYIGFSTFTSSIDNMLDYKTEISFEGNTKFTVVYTNPDKENAKFIWFMTTIVYGASQIALTIIGLTNLYSKEKNKKFNDNVKENLGVKNGS